jgi:hypothetical protein
MITKITFALALPVTAGYGVSKSMNDNADLSLLALSNVEALGQTSGEDVVLPVANMKGAVGQVFQPRQDFILTAILQDCRGIIVFGILLVFSYILFIYKGVSKVLFYDLTKIRNFYEDNRKKKGTLFSRNHYCFMLLLAVVKQAQKTCKYAIDIQF